MVTTDSLGLGARRVLRADAAMAGGILLLGSFLAFTGNSLVQRWQSSSARQESVSFEDQLGITANMAGLIVIGWWAVSLVIAFAAALLERGGRTRAASAAGRFSPGFMRRLALAAVGLQLITAQISTAATLPPPPGTGPLPGAVVSTAWLPAPHVSLGGRQDPPGAVAAVPSPLPPAAGAPVPDPRWRPLRPVVEPGPLASRQLRPQEQAESLGEVTVRAGDSLWSLSAAQLELSASDVDIAAAWPRLYQANRQIIGEDPNVLLPGQVLRLPPCM